MSRSTRTHYPDSEPTSLLLFLLNAACLAENQQILYQLYSLWFDPTDAVTGKEPLDCQRET